MEDGLSRIKEKEFTVTSRECHGERPVLFCFSNYSPLPTELLSPCGHILKVIFNLKIVSRKEKNLGQKKKIIQQFALHTVYQQGPSNILQTLSDGECQKFHILPDGNQTKMEVLAVSVTKPVIKPRLPDSESKA